MSILKGFTAFSSFLNSSTLLNDLYLKEGNAIRFDKSDLTVRRCVFSRVEASKNPGMTF